MIIISTPLHVVVWPLVHSFLRFPNSWVLAAPCLILQGSCATGQGWPKLHFEDHYWQTGCVYIHNSQTKQQSSLTKFLVQTVNAESNHDVLRPLREIVQCKQNCGALPTWLSMTIHPPRVRTVFLFIKLLSLPISSLPRLASLQLLSVFQNEVWSLDHSCRLQFQGHGEFPEKHKLLP